MSSDDEVTKKDEFGDFAREIYSRLSELEDTDIPIAFTRLGFGLAAGSSEGFKFRNKTGAEAKDLHVEFNKSGVEVMGKAPWGPFHKWSANGTKVDLKKGELSNNGTTDEITFYHPKKSEFKITKWWWTDQAGKIIGTENGPDHADIDPE